MKRHIVITTLLVCLVGWVVLGQPAIEAKLMATAQRSLPQVSTNEIVRAIGNGLWNSNRTALAIAIPKPKAPGLFVFLRQANGGYLAVDVSGMERANIGYLGPDRHYERVETVPLKWSHREDGFFEIQMRTRAWSSGRRYTAAGPLVIKPDGTPLWR